MTTRLRVGIGFDQHPFATGSERNGALVLGGVRFEAEQGLAGHSDADVVAHAVADAMLGAAASAISVPTSPTPTSVGPEPTASRSWRRWPRSCRRRPAAGERRLHRDL